jgi:WhiB family redox-sensing transcriptional regulator
MERAKCRNIDKDVFFPLIVRGQVAWREYKQAVQICKKCAVRKQCLDYALRLNELDYGVYGGKTPRERRRIVNREKKRRPRIKRRAFFTSNGARSGS